MFVMIRTVTKEEGTEPSANCVCYLLACFRKRSVVGFCATTNDAFTKYYSTVKFQGVGQEIVDELSACFESALENEKIMVFRDGVGEGQFLEVVSGLCWLL